MRRVIITGTPPQRWINKAENLTNQLMTATTDAARKQIIDDNEGLWRDDDIRDWLLQQFFNKCWYTEAEEVVSAIHVDHFRPKGRVTNLDGSTEDGYWWLTFNWKNYVIAGQLINTKKKDFFPLFGGPRACPNWCDAQLGTEDHILIDPKTDETRLISYEMTNADMCIAVPAAGIDGYDLTKAENTIEILGLNRLNLLNIKRGKKWNDCIMEIANYKGAASQNARNLTILNRELVVNNLKKVIKYESEFSSIAEACIRKNAPEPLIAQLFNP